jgi:hypothetical protein
LYLLQGGLDALLEVAPVLRTGQHTREIQGNDTLSDQVFRYVAGHDALGQPLHDGGFSTPGSPMSTGLFLVRRERI